MKYLTRSLYGFGFDSPCVQGSYIFNIEARCVSVKKKKNY